MKKPLILTLTLFLFTLNSCGNKSTHTSSVQPSDVKGAEANLNRAGMAVEPVGNQADPKAEPEWKVVTTKPATTVEAYNEKIVALTSYQAAIAGILKRPLKASTVTLLKKKEAAAKTTQDNLVREKAALVKKQAEDAKNQAVNNAKNAVGAAKDQVVNAAEQTGNAVKKTIEAVKPEVDAKAAEAKRQAELDAAKAKAAVEAAKKAAAATPAPKPAPAPAPTKTNEDL